MLVYFTYLISFDLCTDDRMYHPVWNHSFLFYHIVDNVHVFFVLFLWQHRVISDNGWYRSKNYPTIKSYPSIHIVPSDRKLFKLLTPPHWYYTSRIHEFPHPQFVLNMYPSVAAPRRPRLLRNYPSDFVMLESGHDTKTT